MKPAPGKLWEKNKATQSPMLTCATTFEPTKTNVLTPQNGA